MYKKIVSYSLFCVLLLNFHYSVAQNKLLLCSGYDNAGSYSGAYENWAIQKGGNYMYMFYQSATPINDTLFVKIEKTFDRKDTNYFEYDHYYLVPSESKKWAVNKYTFTKSGYYKITVYDRSNNPLAAPYSTFIGLEEKAYDDMYFRDTWYYNTSRIDFYEKATGDTMFGKKTVFTYRPEENSKVILYIGQDEKRPFKTDHIVAKIYSLDNCHDLIATNTYYVHEDWHWTFLPIYFKQKGKYQIELYNDDDVFINKASLEIK